ncbi:hypothetical protein [Stenotrophomonas sp.]|uniref:hypothetical protein n=1 Tax=Stenotrophomonas sp. TaxID=69392 RepID=UPI0028ABDB36|nr:hypothetical protein [Stenotrophomonas sp.]
MAESQSSFTYGLQTVNELIDCLSRERLHSYLLHSKTEQEGLELYLYNARVSKSFLFPLHILEITLRNSIDREISKSFTQNWHTSSKFTSILTLESHDSLNRALLRCQKLGKNTKGDLIATLSFDFWSNLFRQEYDRPLWQTRIHLLLPNHPAPSRRSFQKLVSEINHFRNRIAHYEPIIGLDTSGMHHKITEASDYLSKSASKWIKSHSTVQRMIRTSPRQDEQITVEAVADVDFIEVDAEEKLAHLVTRKNRFFISLNTAGSYFAFDMANIGTYVSNNLHAGLIDLSDHTVEHLIAQQQNSASITIQRTEPLNSLGDHFKKANAPILIVLDGSNIKGVIARAHRKY